MEFIDKNLINTTTMFTVQSQTSSVANIFKRDDTLQWTSDGYNNDLTTTSITIDLGATSTFCRIGLIGINWQDFTIFYDGTTANTLSITSTSATTTSDWVSNSETAMYLAFSTVQAQTITFDMKDTILSDSEKAVSYIHISDSLLDFGTYGRLPSSKGYKPRIKAKQVVHQLSNGRVRLHQISEYYRTDLKLKYITAAFRDALFNVWKEQEDFAFVAFGTTTSWDKVLYPVVWPGEFNFYEYADDAPDVGFIGSISLMETEP